MPRVLCVDDSRHIRKMIQSLLPEGYEFLGAGNGQEALDFMQTMHFDVVLLDMIMPVMGGLDTLRALRAKKDTTPVLLFTSLSDQRKLAEAQQLGITDFIIKPSDLEFIKEKLIYVATNRIPDPDIEEGMGENEEGRCEERTVMAPPPRAATAVKAPPVRRLRVRSFEEEEDTKPRAMKLTVAASLDDSLDGTEAVQGPTGLFVVQQVQLPTRVFEVSGDNVTIGRSRDCDLVLGDDSVSRLHCTLKRRRGRFLLTDNSSSNGTTVNGSPVRDQILDHDDQIRIGRFFLTLKISGVDSPENSQVYAGYKKHKGKSKAPDNATKLLQPAAVDSFMAEFALAHHMTFVRLGNEDEVHRIPRDKVELGSAELPCLGPPVPTGIFVEYREGSHWLTRRRLKSQPVSVNDKDTRKVKLKPGDVITVGKVSLAYQYKAPNP